MKSGESRRAACAVCGKSYAPSRMTRVETLHPRLRAMLTADHPELPADATICADELVHYRQLYLEQLLAKERGEISALEREVVEAMAHDATLAANTVFESDRKASLGERVADRVAEFGGSWTFILSFGCVLIVWMAANTFALRAEAFDPYPYILLNLVLSCLAAIQAPVIMMSQNRQEGRDRLRAENDYQVNLKAELEIRHLHEKLDHLMQRQWDHLMELQRLQLELLQEVQRRAGPGG